MLIGLAFRYSRDLPNISRFAKEKGRGGEEGKAEKGEGGAKRRAGYFDSCGIPPSHEDLIS